MNSQNRVNAGGEYVLYRIWAALLEPDGIHPASLLACVGALAGHSCQFSVRQAAGLPGADPAKYSLTAVEAADGRTYVRGIGLKRPLISGPMSVWAFVSRYVENVEGELPDVDDIVRHIDASVGTSAFWTPRVDADNQPRHPPIVYLTQLWPQILPVAQSFCSKPAQLHELFGITLQRALEQTAQVVSPMVAATIAMEAAIAMSRVELAAADLKPAPADLSAAALESLPLTLLGSPAEPVLMTSVPTLASAPALVAAPTPAGLPAEVESPAVAPVDSPDAVPFFDSENSPLTVTSLIELPSAAAGSSVSLPHTVTIIPLAPEGWRPKAKATAEAAAGETSGTASVLATVTPLGKVPPLPNLVPSDPIKEKRGRAGVKGRDRNRPGRNGQAKNDQGRNGRRWAAIGADRSNVVLSYLTKIPRPARIGAVISLVAAMTVAAAVYEPNPDEVARAPGLLTRLIGDQVQQAEAPSQGTTAQEPPSDGVGDEPQPEMTQNANPNADPNADQNAASEAPGAAEETTVASVSAPPPPPQEQGSAGEEWMAGDSQAQAQQASNNDGSAEMVIRD